MSWADVVTALNRSTIYRSKSILPMVFLMGKPRPLFLFIFVLFKRHFTEKTVGLSGIQTRIDGVESERDDH